jgi:hypothetical protein
MSFNTFNFAIQSGIYNKMFICTIESTTTTSYITWPFFVIEFKRILKVFFFNLFYFNTPSPGTINGSIDVVLKQVACNTPR